MSEADGSVEDVLDINVEDEEVVEDVRVEDVGAEAENAPQVEPEEALDLRGHGGQYSKRRGRLIPA